MCLDVIWGRLDVTVDSYHLCWPHLDLDHNFGEGTPRRPVGRDLLPPLPSRCLPGARGGIGPHVPWEVLCPLHGHLSRLGSPSLLITCVLSSLSFVCVWSRQVDRGGGGGRFSPTGSERTGAGRPLLGLRGHSPGTGGQMWALLVGRCLLLRFACLRLLVERGLRGRVMTLPLLVPAPRPGAKLF